MALNRRRHTQDLERSRSSSISQAAQACPQLEQPLSSNNSIEDGLVHNGVDFSIEGIDSDEAADNVLDEDVLQPYQTDLASVLNGLKSPILPEQDPQLGEYCSYGSQDYANWSMDDTAMDGSIEGTKEAFPELMWSNEHPVEGLFSHSNATNATPIPTSSEMFSSSFPPTNHPCASSRMSELPSTLVSDQTFGRPRGISVSTAPQAIDPSQPSALPIRSKSNKSKSTGGARRSRRSSLNDSKKSVPLTRVTPGPKKGARAGQLPPAKAFGIAQKRVEKTVCISCKSRRVTVSDQEDYSHLQGLTQSSAISTQWTRIVSIA